MTVTPIFDDLSARDRVADAESRRTVGGGIVIAAGRRPSPVRRPAPADATAFGQGCLDHVEEPDEGTTHGDTTGRDATPEGATPEVAPDVGATPPAAPGEGASDEGATDKGAPDEGASDEGAADDEGALRVAASTEAATPVASPPDEPAAPEAATPDEADAPSDGCGPPDDVLVALVEAARREVAVLGHGRVGTEHLLLAVVRAGGETGRAFGLRRAGAAVIAAVCADGPVPGELVAPDGAPGLSVAAGTALTRARRRAAARDRACRPTDLALALLDAGRSATLLTDLGVDRDDLADVLAREDLDLPVTPAVRADVRPGVPAPTPLGTLSPVALMLPGPPAVPAAGDMTAPLRIGPPPGSPARRAARARAERLRAETPLDLPA